MEMPATVPSMLNLPLASVVALPAGCMPWALAFTRLTAAPATGWPVVLLTTVPSIVKMASNKVKLMTSPFRIRRRI